MITFLKRSNGPLFSEQIRITPPGEKKEVSAVVIADNMLWATVKQGDKVLYKGRLEYRKGTDSGRPTRVLVFIPRWSRKEYVVREEPLSATSNNRG